MTRFVNPLIQAIDLNGDVDTGATLGFYEPGTLTLKTIYSDSALTTPTTNPQTPDLAGRFVNDVFIDGLYRLILTDGNAQTVFDFDPFGDTASGQLQEWDASNIYEIPDIVLGSDNNYYRSLTDSNQGNDPTSSPSQWEQLYFGRIWNTNVTYGVGDSAIDSNGYYYASNSASNQGNNPTTDTSNTDWEPAVRVENIDVTRLDVTTLEPLIDTSKTDLSNFKATQAQQETGTSTDVYTSPGVQRYHGSANNVQVSFDGTGTIAYRYNFRGGTLTDNGIGDYTVGFAGSFSDADYGFTFGARDSGSAVFLYGNTGTAPAAGSFRVNSENTGGSLDDAQYVCISFFGDE